VIHALNEWLYETWQFNYEDRIFTTPVITLPIVEKAIEEIEWVAERGARAVLIRPAPVPGFRGPRSFALPEFDPVWAKIVEHKLHVTMHSSDSGYSRYYSEWLGSQTEMLPFKPDAFSQLQGWRPVEDAAASWVCHGALTRFPDLRISFVENGASWIAPLFRSLENIYKKMPQDFAEEPIGALRRAMSISPFWEDDYAELAELIGEDNVLFGSDFPHPEGLAQPRKTAEELFAQFPEETVRKFMGGNLARLMHLDATVGVPA
jgi:predicted TIM-barrel fold metal-dependent hydrolase